MLDDFEAGDILLLDRGYEGVDHLYEIHKRGQHFIARMRAAGSCSEQVKALLRSDKKSIVVEVKTKSGESYPVRLVKMGRDRVGLPIVLCTSLIDKAKYSNREIFDLYLRRWEIETMYHRVKQLFSVEKFYARSLNGVLQEIWANLFMLGLAAFTVHATNTTTHVSAPSFKNASEVVRRHLHYALSVRLTPRLALKCARKMLEQIDSIHSRKQLGRKNPRISKRPTTKWNIHRPLAKNRPNQPYKRAGMAA
jgi:IS4 transposase